MWTVKDEKKMQDMKVETGMCKERREEREVMVVGSPPLRLW